MMRWSKCPEPSVLEPLTTVDRMRASISLPIVWYSLSFWFLPHIFSNNAEGKVGWTVDSFTDTSSMTLSDNGRDFGRRRYYSVLH